jgi:hypothetical protein
LVESFFDQEEDSGRRDFSMPPRKVSRQVMTACGKNSRRKIRRAARSDFQYAFRTVVQESGTTSENWDVQSAAKSFPMNQPWISPGSNMHFIAAGRAS